MIRFCMLFFFTLCNSYAYAEQPWQAGDLIFRRGTEAISNVVLQVDRSGFSHVGMLFYDEQAGWQVVHATPEEVEGRGDAVTTDPIDFFLSPDLATQYQVYQVNATPVQRERAVKQALSKLGHPFSILSSDGVYCTTLVWNAWLQAGVDLEVSFGSMKGVFPSNGSILMLHDLIQSPRMSPLGALHEINKHPTSSNNAMTSVSNKP